MDTTLSVGAALSPLQILLFNLCGIIRTESSLLDQDSLIASLRALNQQEDYLKEVFPTFRPIQAFTQKQLGIIRDARAGSYKKSDIEGVFYTHGGDEGLLALLTIVKDSSKFTRLWSSIHEGFRPWFVKRVIELFELFDKDMITISARVLLEQREPSDRLPLQYLGRNAGRKRGRASSIDTQVEPIHEPSVESTKPQFSRNASAQTRSLQIDKSIQSLSAQLPSLQQMGLITTSENSSKPNCAFETPHANRTKDQMLNNNFHQLTRRDVQRSPTADHISAPQMRNREMKDMYSNGPASDIVKIPEPFRAAIQSSSLWKWERSQGLETTGCWPSLFPMDSKQDVSFTIWVGNRDGEHLTNLFNLSNVSL